MPEQRYICEAAWHGEAGPVGTRRWALLANTEREAMEEMFALHASESDSVDTGGGIGSYSFVLKRTEDEWQALQNGC